MKTLRKYRVLIGEVVIFITYSELSAREYARLTGKHARVE